MCATKGLRDSKSEDGTKAVGLTTYMYMYLGRVLSKIRHLQVTNQAAKIYAMV